MVKDPYSTAGSILPDVFIITVIYLGKLPGRFVCPF
jgi:hypothetical protein